MILHKEIYCQSSFTSIDDYIKFMEDISEKENGWLEWQAHEFAAHVLMPTDMLKKEVDRIVKNYGLGLPIKAVMIETSFFENLPTMFGVSPVALFRRMQKEGLIDTEDVPSNNF